jgi:hypothetical protein
MNSLVTCIAEILHKLKIRKTRRIEKLNNEMLRHVSFTIYHYDYQIREVKSIGK